MFKAWLRFSGLILVFVCSVQVYAQRPRCATGSVMEQFFQMRPAERIEFEKRQQSFQRRFEIARRLKQEGVQQRVQSIITIPVVVHIVMDNPNLVTDEQVQSQLDALNADYAGENLDAVNVPAAFASVFGKSQIRFCLAQRTPGGTATNGIIRKTSLTTSTPGSNDPIKRNVTGGADGWDVSKYLNIWVCKMTDNNDLGYTFMPGLSGISESDIGLVTAYHAFGTMGTATAPFNKGRTATHEIGHFFNLWHIWGDNQCVASCSDSDFVDDTPNQSTCTYGTPSFPTTDICTNNAPGIMFMNFMDYVNDGAMYMFTQGQVERMELALATLDDRKSLLTSNGCEPPVLYNNDVRLNSVSPNNSIIYCSGSVQPSVSITNLGTQQLTSIRLNASVDGAAPVTSQVNLSLPTLQTVTITAPALNVSPGHHTLKVFTSLPNGVADQQTNNDTLTTLFSALAHLDASVMEGFETNFNGWGVDNNSDIVSYNPTKVTNAAYNGSASIKYNSFNYTLYGRESRLVSPRVNIPADADSVKITFWRAAAQLNSVHSDTLDVLYSVDCGQSFVSVYKRSGSALNTNNIITSSEYIPASDHWIADTIDITQQIAGLHPDVIVAFRMINGYGNNIYLDDVNIYSVRLPNALKEKGLTISPNPTSGIINIRHYPTTSGLQGITVYSSTGQLVFKEQYNGGFQAPNFTQVNLWNQASGIYIVRLVYADRVVTRKILKMN